MTTCPNCQRDLDRPHQVHNCMRVRRKDAGKPKEHHVLFVLLRAATIALNEPHNVMCASHNFSHTRKEENCTCFRAVLRKAIKKAGM